MTWYGAKAFAAFYGFDLPTEAEWEYACRGGNRYRYGTYDNILDRTRANYEDYGTRRLGASIVGTFPANPFGLYDMSGNVAEWCHDFHAVYSEESALNPTGPSTGEHHVIRGGHYYSDRVECRSAYRSAISKWTTEYYIGFRVVRRPNGVIY